MVFIPRQTKKYTNLGLHTLAYVACAAITPGDGSDRCLHSFGGGRVTFSGNKITCAAVENLNWHNLIQTFGRDEGFCPLILECQSAEREFPFAAADRNLILFAI